MRIWRQLLRPHSWLALKTINVFHWIVTKGPVHSDPLFWTTSLVVGPWGILASYTCVRAILPQCSNLSHACVVREARPMLNFLNQCYSFTGNYRSFRIHAELLKCKKRIYVLSLFKCFIFFLRMKLIRLGIIYLETYLSCIGFHQCSPGPMTAGEWPFRQTAERK